MSKMRKTNATDKKPASPDTLVQGAMFELTEDELERVSGGVTTKGYEKWIEVHSY